MTELEKCGLYLAYVLLIFVPIWCAMMLHEDLTRISSKLEKIKSYCEETNKNDH